MVAVAAAVGIGDVGSRATSESEVFRLASRSGAFFCGLLYRYISGLGGYLTIETSEE